MPAVVALIETWVRDYLRVIDGEVRGVLARDDADEDIARVKGSLTGANAFRFYVMRDACGRVGGMAGLGPPDPRMQAFAATDRPFEMVSVFLDPKEMGKGLGLWLVNALFDKARAQGYTEALWNSGPRYARTAWGFYTRNFGDPVAVVAGYYAGKWDARVWKAAL